MAIEQEIVTWLERHSDILDLKETSGRKAFLFKADLTDLQNKLKLEETTAIFCSDLVQRLRNYGALSDGRDPLTAVLEAAKTMVGRDKQAECDALIARLQSAPRSRQAGWPSTTPRHLPPIDAYFVDREQQLADLMRDLYPGKVVTLCGMGGIGKTALAAQAARQIEPERFPDGILFHSFYKQRDHKVALEYIAATFGIEPKLTPEKAAQIALAGRQALLILDGTEEADDLRPILNVRGTCGVLITSRKKHDALQTRLNLSPLSQQFALDLLNSWRGAQGMDAAAQQICEILDGLPLAVRLVGHYLSETGEPATEYLAWLKTQPFDALDRGDHRDESVKVLLRRSVAQLSELARQSLAVIGLLAFAPCAIEPLAAALDCDIRQCQTAAGELVNFGILQTTADRYEMCHRLIHTYAQHQLPSPPEALERLVAYYLNFIKEQQQHGRAGYAQMDPERFHLMQVLETCQERAMWSSVSVLVGKIDTYLDRQGYWSERQAALKMNLIAAHQQADQSDEAWCVNNLGLTCLHRGDYATALTYLEQSLAIQRDIGDKAGEGTTLNNLSQIYDARGDYATALTYLEQSLAIQREIGDKAGEGATLNNLSQIFKARGDYATALTYLEQSLAIRREIGDIAGVCATLFNMGHIHVQNEELQEALEAWGTVYRLAKPRNLAQALEALDNLAGQLGLPGGSEAWEKLAADMDAAMK
ncbi:TPR repeat protein [Candidatus Vecturithrix granuli]|uniref:TPR repeat protein n=1 Tax=Vecturithrix granuli TaxID=1499967 RepID=A0A081C7P4_VECG1|nr:TPR repeat protein [Candidatus Vecturithrix granuli]